MRYSKEHKQETHDRIVRKASVRMREKGAHGIGVADLMKEAGLTHGGFYAHFKSKDALLYETLAEIFARSKRRFARLLEGLPPKHALATYIDYYVAESHRDDPASGCPITALNSDMPRQSKKVRALFENGVKLLVGTLAERMTAAGIADAEKLAPSILAAMAGAVALSRTISDRHLSDELLASSRAGIKARLGLTELSLASEKPL